MHLVNILVVYKISSSLKLKTRSIAGNKGDLALRLVKSLCGVCCTSLVQTSDPSSYSKHNNDKIG